MSAPVHKVSTIPAGENFAHILAGHILDQSDGSPESIAHYKILLPTRRACRTLQEAFLHLKKGKPILLPRITTLGDVEEQDLSLLTFGNHSAFLDIPPAIPAIRRKLLLAKLIQRIPEFTQGTEHALKLADAIASLHDQVIIEELDFKNLQDIVPQEFADHWQITLDFLKIISEQWPKILAEQNMVDPATRRNLLMDHLAKFWEDNPPDTPIIAAGSTGSVPATRRLMKVIASLPKGEIIIPGLDQHMNEQSWKTLEESHPQHGLKNLIEFIGIERKDVATLKRSNNERAILASELMRPAATSDQWKNFPEKADIESMLQGLEYYPCKNPQQEAQIIALIIRETLENTDKNIALITPDRNIAKRVIAACKRWDIELDDSGGTKLSHTSLGQFILLTLQNLKPVFDPVSLLALLKHPYCRLGYDEKTYKKLIRQLELGILRSKRPPFSFEAIKSVAQNEHGNEALLPFIEKLGTVLNAQEIRDDTEVTKLIEEHLKILHTLANTDKQSGEILLWREDEGEKAAELFIDLQDHAYLLGNISHTDYEDLLNHLMEQVIIRKSDNLHPQVSILGQLEGRMTSADLIIISGLNEETWPPPAGHDPWMSRPMRKTFGLPAPEKFTGLAAHDFVQGFCAANTIITRSEQTDGSPTVPARWLARLDTVLQGCGKSLDDLSPKPYMHWLEEMDSPSEFRPYSRPEPRPPLSARPSKMSVTKIENWLKNPYMIYAYYTLNLKPVNPLKIKHDAALYGSILHSILDQFVRNNPLKIPENALEILENHTKETLIDFGITETEIPFWLARFKNISQWFLDHEKSWRIDAKFQCSEAKGSAIFPSNNRNFELECRADRVDLLSGGYALIDYKSSNQQLTAKKIEGGSLPQLPLEALILAKSGFTGMLSSTTPTLSLSYWVMSGGQDAGQIIETRKNIDQTLQIVEEGLVNLIEIFDDPTIPYYAIPDTLNAPRFDDYEQLSRLKEWAVLDNTSEEAA
ncbi:MAG: double-strand break repair protein AddB [Alphaproteobacteria bacterium]|nr:double-strand break repair protein AddB [Alphaproteobacteria bacterium]